MDKYRCLKTLEDATGPERSCDTTSSYAWLVREVTWPVLTWHLLTSGTLYILALFHHTKLNFLSKGPPLTPVTAWMKPDSSFGLSHGQLTKANPNATSKRVTYQGQCGGLLMPKWQANFTHLCHIFCNYSFPHHTLSYFFLTCLSLYK